MLNRCFLNAGFLIQLNFWCFLFACFCEIMFLPFLFLRLVMSFFKAALEL